MVRVCVCFLIWMVLFQSIILLEMEKLFDVVGCPFAKMHSICVLDCFRGNEILLSSVGDSLEHCYYAL